MSKPSTPVTSPKLQQTLTTGTNDAATSTVSSTVSSTVLPSIISTVANSDNKDDNGSGKGKSSTQPTSESSNNNGHNLSNTTSSRPASYSHVQLDKPILNPPATPSPPNRKRVSATFVKTPEQQSKESSGLKRNSVQLPFTPSYKRTSTGGFRSPDGKLSYHNVNSPYSAAHLLKTPRHSLIDDDSLDNDNDHDNDNDNKDEENGRKLKMIKTPQYLNTAKRLFQNDDSLAASQLQLQLQLQLQQQATYSASSPPRDNNFLEISSQLKNKLSSAFGKLQKDEALLHPLPHKITFTELSFDSQTSPTKKYNPETKMKLESTWVPTKTLNRANLNLQTLQLSPLPNQPLSSTTSTTSPAPAPTSASALGVSPRKEHFGFRSNTTSPLKNSPVLKQSANLASISRLNDMPSPDEESNAQAALLAALSRLKRKSFSSNPEETRNNNGYASSGNHQQQRDHPHHNPQYNANHRQSHDHSRNHSLGGNNPPLQTTNAPPLNINTDIKLPPIRPRSSFDDKNNEKDAVYSLMALASPQAVGSRRGVVFNDETDDDEGNVSDETVDED